MVELVAPGEDQDGQLGLAPPDAPEQLEPVHPGQADVGDDDVPALGQPVEGRLGRPSHLDGVAGGPEHGEHELAQDGVVVDDQHLGGHEWAP